MGAKTRIDNSQLIHEGEIGKHSFGYKWAKFDFKEMIRSRNYCMCRVHCDFFWLDFRQKSRQFEFRIISNIKLVIKLIHSNLKLNHGLIFFDTVIQV